MLSKLINACKKLRFSRQGLQLFSALQRKKVTQTPTPPSLKWAHGKVTDVLQQLEDVSYWSCQPDAGASEEVRRQCENAISRASTLRDELLIQIRARKENPHE